MQHNKTKFIRPFFFSMAFAYVAFHALHGEQGVYALLKETHKIEHLNAKLYDITITKDHLEKRVSLMRSESLDKDMLEEQARSMLGMTEKDEIIIMTK